MGTGVIVEKCQSWVLTEHWNDDWSNHAVDILPRRQITIHKNKFRLEIMVDGSPYHYTTSTETVMFHGVTFIATSITSNSAISVRQVKS